MRKIQRRVAVAIVAAVVAVAGLARPEPAAAMACADALVLAEYYAELGDIAFWAGDRFWWGYWNRQAALVLIGCT